MLVQFLVENFLSFKEETIFSMLAPPGETRAVAVIPEHDGLRLMRVAAFYGANASGKSNLVKALRAACSLVARGILPDGQLPAQPFRLTSAPQQMPTRFQFDFLVEGTLYTYTLILTSERILGEALCRRCPRSSDEELVYEREDPSGAGEHVVKLGAMVLSGDAEQQQFARFVARAAPVQQPLLSEFATRNVPGFAPIQAWFEQGLTVVGPSDAYPHLVSELFENSALRIFYGDMLSAMGTGIRKVDVLKERDNDSSPDAIQRYLMRIVSNNRIPEQQIFRDENGKYLGRLSMILEHSLRDGSTVPFPLTEESDGTQRLLHLLPVLFHRTKDHCTVIDELDRSLHTALTRRFVEQFMAMASGALSQLIFTTHDTNLLNGRLLPSGSIWFVEKDDDGASHLHSLADYPKAQLDHLLEHLEEGYLQGRFGAIPFLAHRDSLGWQPEEEAK